MLHIIRSGESLIELSELYDIAAEDILRANSDELLVMLSEESAIAVPTEHDVLFTAEPTKYSELAQSLGCSLAELLQLNEASADIPLPKNLRYRAPKAAMPFEVSAVYTISGYDNDFVRLDANAAGLSKIMIAAYTEHEGRLNLPYDYPAINACRINGASPMFYIADTAPYRDPELFAQLQNDLSFKDYSGGLFELRTAEDIEAIRAISPEIWKMDMSISVCGEQSILSALGSSALIDFVYYKPERNIFDFESFAKVIAELSDLIAPEKLGLWYIGRAADIDRTSSNITYLKRSELPKLSSRHNIEKIVFDERSALCFFKYEDGGAVHNVVYEDIRSFYAKAALLRELGITEIILGELSGESRQYLDALSQLARS